MNTQEKKLLKLQSKAEKCITHDKAVKLLKKHAKASATLHKSIRSNDTLI